MMYLTGFGRRGCFGLKAPQCAAIVFAAFAAGCSADVSRFDSTSFALNDPPESTSAMPTPPESVRGGTESSYNNPVARTTPRGPYGAGAKSVDVAALPDATPAAPVTPRPYAVQDWKKSPEAPLRPAAAAPAMAASPASVAATGNTIDVQPGDTLFGLSKRHHVSVAELMTANSLTSASLKPGQKLVLPAGGAAATMAAVAPKLVLPPTTPLAPPTPAMLAKYGATYTVKPGDSLYGISRAYKVPFTELQQVNAITDVRKVKPGAVIKVPGTATAAAETLAQPVAPAAPRITQTSPPSSTAPAQPSVINAPKQVASLDDKATDASPLPVPSSTAPAKPAPKADRIATAAPQAATQAGDSVKLRWPAQGKVIAGFGGRPDGTHNDGINLSVPLGTEVHAAESGVVAYAGSELKGYGNLVLIRHDNGWVTAYAHNDELLVKRGDKIKRGQVIGKAGKTGTVDQPQVHFELRQGSKPVDPTPFMEKI